MKVLLPHHTYSCIRRDQSPRQVSGFQTLGVTRDQINDRDVRAIEQRARYSVTSSALVKYMYYQLPSGSVAVGHICAIPDLDEHGRGNNFLMHTLVIPPKLWQDLASGPFGVLAATPFATSLREILEESGSRAGDLAPLSVTISDEMWDHIVMAESIVWSEQFFLDLTRVISFRQLPQERQLPIVVTGASPRVIPLFALLLALIPPSERKNYSFDTCATGCRWSRDTFFWAVAGLTAAEIPRGAWIINPEQQTVTLDPGSNHETTPYEHWIKRSLRTGDRPALLAYQQSALALSDVLIGKVTPSIALENLPEPFVNEFTEANMPTLISRAIGTLGFPLIRALRDVLEQQLSYLPPSHILALALNQNEGREMLDLVYRYVAHPDRQAVCKMHAQYFVKLERRHPGLMLLGAHSMGDATFSQIALEACDSAAYQKLVVPLVHQWVLPARSVFTRKHTALWFEALAIYASCDDIVAIAEQLKTTLDQLTPFVAYLRPEQQLALRDWLVQSRRRTQTLQYALESHVGRVPTFFENLRQRFTSDSDSDSRTRRRR